MRHFKRKAFKSIAKVQRNFKHIINANFLKALFSLSLCERDVGKKVKKEIYLLTN